ncbi:MULTISPECIES: aminotransferase class I/II-fold pyridoxal phosphate-dependent enzyme [Brenneria]|uniref:Aminotransferase class I/II-fold pyridoxal phosphate-dependent enzyme n=1 Tax=Brenneria nigrifluens DSM 30175 = ATCC 13028 TaxID=1121120 RepID=A0A2U1URV7_9GAMM|nr:MULTISPECIES: aminotransferase class I/II-fold pyridoxal phosphate-dependent enzyme [Brenneria]EHD23047.1 transcriptional regulator, GntR family with aminotransferase domain [Brenneria sp. EniD312]PWC24403.1 GntR family transcriptional regulator [Brenneria nigrifluens DSM 30175 = ATCC 13028]QCR05942.1 aminotransferase class I/II-fold pyridoxal phosphate-dependent enzyme [Brenneria nigrifluens DSM 30175 = ATCC 13028]
MAKSIDTHWLAAQLHNHSIRGIAMDMSALIGAGKIAIGSQLPPVRELADALGVSPATISAAWSQLRRQKVIAGRGRTGMWVYGQQASPRPERFEKIGNFGDAIIADLTLSAPDPALLPDLGEALLYGAQVKNLNSYQRTPIIAELEEQLRKNWPYAAEAFMTSDGGFDGVNLTLQTLIFPGSTVVIESPTAARLLDLLDHIGINIIQVACDEQGPVVEALRQALQHKPAAFIYQPRTHSHTGYSVSPARMAAMAALFVNSPMTMIIEDDGVGEISSHPALSMGAYYPAQTIYVRSYSKAYGPDLRMAALSGSAEIIGKIQSFRNFGAGWSSRILQGALAFLLADEKTHQGIEHARQVYHQRRQWLADALARRGIYVPENDSLCIWLPVPSERYALITMAAHGVAVQPGERFGMKNGHYVRLSISQLQESLIETIAEAVSQIYR